MSNRVAMAVKARPRKSTASSKKKSPKTAKLREQIILERLAISESEYPNVYWVGRKAMRLTFLSQQQRALNLVWALNKLGKLGPKTRVTVVGAGLAGMTAAFAANQLGASVTLLEARQVPLHLQLGCWLRFVHPHILNWPQKDSDNPLTDLPCLNWGADMAARVCNTVLEQWSAVEKTVKTYYGYEVRGISILNKKYPLVFAEGTTVGENLMDETRPRTEDGKVKAEDQRRGDERRGNYEKDCDCLILSVGFGLERPLASVPFLSYWENDNFGRPLITGPIPRRYLVTGCGDGGLIDAIRLSLNAFDHADFVYSLSNMEGLDETKAKLLEIDEWIAKALRDDSAIREKILKRLKEAKERTTPDAFDEARVRKRVEIDIQGELLEEKYRSLEIPPQLKELITKRLRQDTIVYLNSPSTSPLSLGASILNRFVVFLMRTYGFLRYRAGEIEVLPTRSGQPLRVLFHHEQFPKEELEIHELVVRHGPVPAIDRLFPARIVADARLSPDDFEDPTREPQYRAEDNFLKLPLLVQQKERVYQNYALASTPLAARKFFTIGSFDRFGVEVAQGKVNYVRRPLREQVDDSQGASYFGIEVRSDPPVGKQIARVVGSEQVNLVCGVGVKNIGKGPRSASQRLLPKEIFGTLGCFVRLKDGRNAFLTTAGALCGPHMKLGDQIVLANRSSKRPKAIATLTDFRLPKPSSPLASVAAGTVEYNQFQAAIATLEPDAKPQTGFGKAFPKSPQLKHDPATSPSGEEIITLKSKVFKVGAMTGLTRGTITNVLISTEMHAWGEVVWYENLFAVSSLNSKPFALAGDGGALVIREDGTILGMVIGGNSTITYACPITPVFTAFACLPILSDSEFQSP